LSPAGHGLLDFGSGTKSQTVMPKRIFLLHGTLKIVYQVYHSIEEKQKRKSKFFNRDTFYAL